MYSVEYEENEMDEFDSYTSDDKNIEANEANEGIYLNDAGKQRSCFSHN